MASQFDLYRVDGGDLVVILQSDLLDRLQTRVVAPLVPAGSVDRVMTSLNPAVTLGEAPYLVMPQLAATLALAELGERVGSLAQMHDEIVRAVDALLSGI
ncbi:CcdB family protein [Psychromarinibacter sp. C21-152]|uniref:Toxin CcdB n=1 Tax=Psychromarinibacter sediminicola TaxID=3033385 RepID=A0AAE3NMM1_9RHOB|nr:CcdB family protein [Psychromarinibacter sediminicola]MDF0600678.1 CcdB family protein [Psychromarinibacter sediminicola]